MTTKNIEKKNKKPPKGKSKTQQKTPPKKITLKDLDDPTLSELEPIVLDVGKRYKVAEYIEFVKWTALPTPERKPKTAQLFAEKHKMNNAVLSRWKNTREFWEDVSRIRKATMHDDFAEVVQALKRNIIKTGKGQDVKVFAQIAEILKEDGNGSLTLSPALEDALSKLAKRLPN